MGRLGVGGTIRLALEAIWSQRRILGPVLLGWLTAEAVFRAGYRYFRSQLRDDLADLLAPGLPWVSSWDWPYLLHLAAAVPNNLYGSFFVVLVMRIFLFATPLGPHEFRATLGRSVLAIFLFRYAMSTYHTAWQWVAYPLAGYIPPEIVWTFFWTIGVAVTARFCLLYATASMGRGWQLRRCWRDAAGNGFRLFLMFLAIDIPVLAIGRISDSLVLASVADPGSGAGLALLAFLGAVKRIAASTILLALIAVVFARLTESPAAGIPDARRRRSALLEAFE